MYIEVGVAISHASRNRVVVIVIMVKGYSTTSTNPTIPEKASVSPNLI
jgi:hypothetical protein